MLRTQRALNQTTANSAATLRVREGWGNFHAWHMEAHPRNAPPRFFVKIFLVRERK